MTNANRLQIFIQTFVIANFVSMTAFGIDLEHSVLTYHTDNQRTGQSLFETSLTRKTVQSGKFGKIGSAAVDGIVYAQPLYVKSVQMADGKTHDVLIVATEHDSVYAFDASTPSPTVLWKRSFIGDAELPCMRCRTLSMVEVNAPDVAPEIGITATPVIDPVTGIIYVSAATFEGPNTTGLYFVRLHALNIGDGSEVKKTVGGQTTAISPVPITSTLAGTGVGNVNGQIRFDAYRQLSRSGLGLSQGHVYVAFSSYNDQEPAHGWIFSYSAATLQFEAAFMTTPRSGDGNIWMAGGAPAIDGAGNVYFASGNGDYKTLVGTADDEDAQKDYHDSIMKMSPSLTYEGYFKPSNALALAEYDVDLGSGGVLLLPNEAGSSLHQQLMTAGGKEGTFYLLDRNKLGQFNPVGDFLAVQELVTGSGGLPGGTNFGPGIYGTPSYFNHHIYIVGAADSLRSYPISNAVIDWFAMQQATREVTLRGATTSISANGAADGIAWFLNPSAFTYTFSVGNYEVLTNGPSVLMAYNSDDLSHPLYQSDQGANDPATSVTILANSALTSTIAADAAGLVTKFAVPTVADGKVFVGNSGEPLPGPDGKIAYQYRRGFSAPGASVYGYSSGGISVYGLKTPTSVHPVIVDPNPNPGPRNGFFNYGNPFFRPLQP